MDKKDTLKTLMTTLAGHAIYDISKSLFNKYFTYKNYDELLSSKVPEFENINKVLSDKVLKKAFATALFELNKEGKIYCPKKAEFLDYIVEESANISYKSYHKAYEKFTATIFPIIYEKKNYKSEIQDMMKDVENDKPKIISRSQKAFREYFKEQLTKLEEDIIVLQDRYIIPISVDELWSIIEKYLDDLYKSCYELYASDLVLMALDTFDYHGEKAELLRKLVKKNLNIE